VVFFFFSLSLGATPPQDPSTYKDLGEKSV
jgi:hypothetical protein